MESPNTGPAWVWKLGCGFALLGVITILGLIIYGIYWLITHITFN